MSTKTLLLDDKMEYRDQYGNLHREDGPAVIYPYDREEWWLKGRRHREDGPAIVKIDGYYEWRYNGKRHRLDGPAMEWTDSDRREYYVDGHEFSLNSLRNIEIWLTENNISYPFSEEEQHKFEERWHNERPFFNGTTKEWRVNGVLHREDGPAQTLKNGDKIWYKNGVIHRADGPAIITGNNTKKWYKEGILHRDDGPAITRINENNEWWVEGRRHRMEGPAVINGNISRCGPGTGHSEWWIDGVKIASEHSHYGKMAAYDKFNSIIHWICDNNIKFPMNEETKLLLKMCWLV